VHHATTGEARPEKYDRLARRHNHRHSSSVEADLLWLRSRRSTTELPICACVRCQTRQAAV
jgi:hypothetical protein